MAEDFPSVFDGADGAEECWESARARWDVYFTIDKQCPRVTEHRGEALVAEEGGGGCEAERCAAGWAQDDSE